MVEFFQSESVQNLLWILLKSLLVIGPLLLVVAYYTLMERKVLNWFQVRTGPLHVGPWGLAIPFADAIKMLFKEIIIPTGANRFLFLLAPILAFGPAIAAWAVIPFDEELYVTDLNAGLLYVLAMTSIGVYGIIIAGWASNSKYPFLGAVRSAAQVVSYELAMGFALVGVIAAAGSMNLREIVMAQQGGIWMWFWIPLLPLFMVYFISGLAETNRPPFDMAEGESEIVAGYQVEYAGFSFGLFFMAEYANMTLISLLTVLMFLGGWLSPFEGIPVLDQAFEWMPGFGWLFIKTFFFMVLFIWVRATFPRYRYDQLMRLGWKVLIPVTIVWLIVVGGAVAAKLGPWFS